MELQKTSEKIIIWLHRNNRSMKWLAEQTGQTRQAISTKLKNNCLTPKEITFLKSQGFKD